MESLKQEFVASLFNVRNRVRFAMDDQFRPLGVTDATWRTLFYLQQAGDGVQQKELARVMGIEGPSLVRLLDNLEAKNFITRKPSPLDRRSKTIHLTSDAMSKLHSLQQAAVTVRHTMLKNVSNEELKVCVRVFRRILETSEEGRKT
jgi:MarR family transcriptional regulator, transcriptional regulator for hemolysin